MICIFMYLRNKFRTTYKVKYGKIDIRYKYMARFTGLALFLVLAAKIRQIALHDTDTLFY